MNKKDMARALSKQTGFTQKDLTEILDAVFQFIAESTAAGEKIRIKNFGIFEVQNRAGRFGQNINAQKTVFIPPKKVPVFKPGLEYIKLAQGE